MATITKVLGPVSAYALAKTKGYTGTEAEFSEDLANSAANARIAAESAQTCVAVANSLPMVQTSTAEEPDLDVADINGNVLVRFDDGHIETKNFDSAKMGAAGDLTTTAKSTLVAAINEVNAAAGDNATAISGIQEDIDEIEDNVGALGNRVDALPAIRNADVSGPDLDIADESGNVLVRMADGGIKSKHFESGWITPPLYTGSASNGTVLFDNTTASEGDIVIYDFDANAGAVGAFIDIKDAQNNRITYIGRPSLGRAIRYTGYYIIPGGFGRAVVATGINVRVLCIVKEYMFDAVRAMTDTDREQITGIRYSIGNRLANPLYTTHEKYNTDHPSAQITAVDVLYPGVTGAAGYRIPSVCVTNAGTVLVAGTHMTNAGGDFGDFSVDVARKPSGGSWSIAEVVPFDTTRQSYGSVLNQEFLVDRTSGRIYLFFGTEKQSEIWTSVTTENGDFRYVYSDDDGANWSSPVSLKSLWDTDKYDYCIPSCTKGIQLTNGTYVVPCFCKKSYTGYSTSWPLLLIKPSGGEWYFSDIADRGIRAMDECAVVEGSTANEIWLYARCNTDYGTGINRGYSKFVYSVAGDSFRSVECTFDANRHNCFGIDRITIDGTLIFLMTFTDTNGSARDNITLWASLDGDVWIRVYRIYKPGSNGYSVIDNYNGQIAVAYETPSKISYQDISALSGLIKDSATKGIARNVSVQDRMQMLYNSLAGID